MTKSEMNHMTGKGFSINQKGNANTKYLVGAGVAIVLIIGALFLLDISYDNKDQRLRADVEDQQRKIEANFDKMWKTISQTAQVTSKYKDDFKDAFTSMIGARYEKGAGQAMLWIKEQNPNLDASMYKKIQTIIEASRISFEREQRKLSQMGAAHKKMFTTKPSMWFLSGEPVEIQIISSGKTKKVMQTGEENDINVFGK